MVLITRGRPLRLSRYSLIAFLLSLGPTTGFGQNVSFSLASGSAAQGGTVSLDVSASSSAGSEPAGVEWTITYPGADFTAIQVTAGPAATAAGKSTSCAGTAGSLTCLTAGINSNTIANGVAAIVTLTVSTTTT